MNQTPFLIELLAVHLPKWDKNRHYAVQSLPNSALFVASPELIEFRRTTLTWKPVTPDPAAVLGKKPAYARVAGVAADYETAIISRVEWAEYVEYIREYRDRVLKAAGKDWFPALNARAVLRTGMGNTVIMQVERLVKNTCYFRTHNGQHFADMRDMNVSPLPAYRGA